jgi:UDP-2-acetamido-2-deoxy-ribo-hexuluronate aminotransferase
MDTIQCSIVLAKLARFDWEIDRRIHLARRYDFFFKSTKADGSPVYLRPDRTSVYAQYTINCANREETQLRMKNSGIPSAIHYPLPLNEQAAYKDVCGGDPTPVACGISKNILSLPMSAYLDEKHQDIICAAFV